MPSAITHRFSPGDRVSVDSRELWPAGHLDAVVERVAPYQGQPGYYTRWDYGRPTEQWETSGGWQPEHALTEAPQEPSEREEYGEEGCHGGDCMCDDTFDPDWRTT